MLGGFYLDDDLRRLVEAMRGLLYDAPCVSFTDLMRVTSWHQQKLSRVLRRGVRLGIITKCVSGDGYDLALSIAHSTIIKSVVTLNVIKVAGNHLIMKHDVSMTLQNTSRVNHGIIFIRVYGDIDWDEPLRFRCCDLRVVEKLDRDKCPSNICNLVFKLSKPIAPGDIINFKYSFNLYYYPPKDYFSLDVLVDIKDVLVRIPKRCGVSGRISLGNVELMGHGFVRTSVGKKYNIVHGRLLIPPGTLKIPIQIQM